MAFLSPLVLLGLAAAAIPLIIHLFNFRKPKRVDFSSLTFLRELEKHTMRRMRLKQWLLLLLRMLSISCLVLAFARPTQSSDWNGVFSERSPTTMAIVVDNSLSMTMRDIQGSYIDQAKALASALLESAQPGDELIIVPSSFEPDATSAEFASREATLDAVEELHVSFRADALSSALSRTASLLEGASNPVREIFLLSDLQATTLLDSTNTVTPENIRLTLMPLGERDHANVAVTDISIVSQIIEPGQPVEMNATIARFGGEAEGYGASVFLEEERVAQTSVDLKENEAETVSFTFTPTRRGWLRGEVRIEPDEAEWDDVRYFALHVPQAQRVLVVRGTNARADLVAVALGVAAERGTLDVTQVDESNLAAAGVENFDAVVLVGPGNLSSGEVALLERYVVDGGGLMLFPGDEAGVLDGLVGALGGGRFGGVMGERDGPSLGGFGSADLEHPLFEGVFDNAAGRPRLESPEVLYAERYIPAGIDESTLIRLAGGTPFLQEVRHGQGSALIYTVAPDPRWSDYAMRGLFIPLLYRSVMYLATTASGASASYTVGENDVLRVEGATQASPLRIISQTSEEWTPTQRTVPGGVLIDMDESIPTPGVYDVMQGGTLLRRVAINLDPLESDLATLSASEAIEQLEEATGRPVRLLNAAGGDGLAAAQSLQAQRRGADLSSILLALALAFLIAEMLVATRWKPGISA